MGVEYKRIDFENNTCKHWRDESIELVSRNIDWKKETEREQRRKKKSSSWYITLKIK